MSQNNTIGRLDCNIKTLENKIVKMINNIITVKELIYKIKGGLKKNDFV